MRWPDTMLIPTYELCTQLETDEIAAIKKSLTGGENPMKYKKDLAYRVTRWVAGDEAAEKAQAHFESVHQKHEKPEDIAVHEVKAGEHALVELLVSTGLCSSKTDARAQIEQGGVRVKDVVTTDPKTMVQIDSEGVLIQKGKRHFVHVKGV
jgi:tyrosyl-tRNA synthetase